MTNQAAQTMPDIDAIVRHAINEHCPNGKWLTGTNTLAMAITSEVTAALSQPAGVAEGGLEAFTDYFVKNYPGPNTIIYNPKWHAPRIFRAAQRAIQAAAPAASGGEDELDRAARRMGDSASALLRDIAEQQAAASVSERAREYLARDYDAHSMPETAKLIRNGSPISADFDAALRAIEQALTQQRGDEPAAWLVEWTDNAGDPTRYIAYCEDDAADKLGVLSDGEAATAKVVPLHTTPQPSADAVREVPDGMVLVPREPTPEMVRAGAIVTDHVTRAIQVYSAMLAAASGEGVESDTWFADMLRSLGTVTDLKK